MNHVQANAVVAAACLNNSPGPFQEATSTVETLSTTNAVTNSDPLNRSESATPPLSGGGGKKAASPLSLSAIVSACTAAKKFQTVNNNSGMSFDQEKFIFREFVEVGVQTNPKGPQSGAEITPSRYE